MSLNGYTTFVLQLATFVARKARFLARRRRRAPAVLGALLLSAVLGACGGTGEGSGQIGVVEGFAGIDFDKTRSIVLVK